MNFVPLLRWSGGKRKQSEDIIAKMPHEIDTVWIPFLGGGSVMYQLLNSNIQFNRVVCSDIYQPLMDIWKLVKDDPTSLIAPYGEYYEKVEERGEEFYNEMVNKFNAQQLGSQDPHLFHFILRSCLRGSIEFDNNGNFCTKFQSKANDNILNPNTFKNLVFKWSESIQKVELRCESYDKILSEVKSGDYCFFDPPYIDGTWYRDNNIDMGVFYNFLRQLPCDYSITLNGDKDVYPIPNDCYTDHEYIYYGVRKSQSGRPTGSRDSFWMMHNILDYNTDIKNVKQNGRATGGSIPQINDIKMMGDIESRLEKQERSTKDLSDKMDQILILLTQSK